MFPILKSQKKFNFIIFVRMATKIVKVKASMRKGKVVKAHTRVVEFKPWMGKLNCHVLGGIGWLDLEFSEKEKEKNLLELVRKKLPPEIKGKEYEEKPLYRAINLSDREYKAFQKTGYISNKAIASYSKTVDGALSVEANSPKNAQSKKKHKVVFKSTAHKPLIDVQKYVSSYRGKKDHGGIKVIPTGVATWAVKEKEVIARGATKLHSKDVVKVVSNPRYK